MVVLNKIYTRGGDKGTTALGSGDRRPKYDLRISAYGSVDETNSQVGIARLSTAGAFPDIDAMLGRIQNDLFDLGADLACPDTGEELPYEPIRMTEKQVTRLETEIDALNKDLEPLRSFVIPGGSPAAAALHVCRTVSRRAEREMVELAGREDEIVDEAALKFINRLSDFFFVAARWVNDKGTSDVLWVPGRNR